MGVVYEAKDDLLDTTVALKTLRTRTPEALARLKREFRVLQSVQHPNLVTLGELVVDEDECFFTMELVDGGDIVTHVRPDGVLDEPRLRQALLQLTDGLLALHAAGMVHRDIKPANVLVGRDGRVVLLDFGLATDLRTESTSDDHVVGTPAYMAPEQAATGTAGPEADWYGVGVVLYEALTGRVPYEGAPLEVLLDKQRKQPPAPSTIASGVAPDLNALCEGLLRFEPAERPTGVRVLRTLGAGSFSASAQTTQDPFVGRAREIEALDRAFRASHGHPIAALVQGESGVGKTSLVARFIERLAVDERDLLVLSGQCWEHGTVAYNALDGIASALARHLALLSSEDAEACLPASAHPLVTVFPVLRRVRAIAAQAEAATPDAQVDQVDLRGRAFSALRELLTRLAETKTLLFVIDDLQWIDGDSLALLADVLRMPDAPPVLLVATVRTGRAGDASAPLRDALGPMGAELREIEVARLPDADAQLLALALLARAAPAKQASAVTIADAAEGHPLTIDVLVRDAMDRDGASAQSAEGSTPGASSRTLDEALWSDVERLSPGAREIVTLLAVAGAPVPRMALVNAVNAERGAFAENVAFLRVSRLVTSAGDRDHAALATYHDAVRAAVISRLDDATKEHLHRRLALVLETAPARDLDAIFRHWRGARDDAHAAKYALAAADYAVERLAFDHATALYDAALAAGTYDAATRAAVNEKLGDAHGNAGRGALAARAYGAAAVGANSARALDLRCRAAAQLLRSGHFDEGLDAAEKLLGDVGLRFARSPFAAVVTLLIFRALFALRGFGFRRRDASLVSAHELARIDVCASLAWQITFADPTQGVAFQQRYLLMALRCGEPARVVRAMAGEVGLSGAAGRRSWARHTSPIMTSTRQLAESVGDARASAIALQAAATATYLGHGDFEGALALSDRAATALRGCTGVAWELAVARLYGLYSLVYLGRWDELGTRSEQFLRDARARGDLFSVVNGSTGLMTCAWLGSDDPGRARRNIADALHTWPKRGFHLAHYYEALGLSLVDLYEGCGDDALARLDAVWPKMRRSFYLRIQALRVEGLDARARAMLAVAKSRRGSERARLLARARQIARGLYGEKVAWGTAMAWFIEAGASHLTGTQEDTEHLLRQAARACDAAGMALHATVARWCEASLDGIARQPSSPVKNFARVVALLAPTFAPHA